MKWRAPTLLLSGLIACSPAPEPAPAPLSGEPVPTAMRSPPTEEASVAKKEEPAPAEPASQPSIERQSDLNAEARLLTYVGQLSVLDPSSAPVAVREELPLLRDDKLVIGEGAVALLFLKNGYLVRLDDDLELHVREIALIDAPDTQTPLEDQLKALVGGALKLPEKARITGWQQGLHAGFGGTIGGMSAGQGEREVGLAGGRRTAVTSPSRAPARPAYGEGASAAPGSRQEPVDDPPPKNSRGAPSSSPPPPQEIAPPKPIQKEKGSDTELSSAPPRYQRLDGDPNQWTAGTPAILAKYQDELLECIAPLIDKREDRGAPIVLLLSCEDHEITRVMLVGAPPSACLDKRFLGKSDAECDKGWLRVELPRP